MHPERWRENRDSDRQLYERAKADFRDFKSIFEKYYSPIFGYALRRTGDLDAAAEIAAATFAKALGAFKRFQWREIPLSSWLYRIATNELTRHYRSRRLRLDIRIIDSAVERELSASLEDDREAVEAELHRHQQFLWLRAAVAQLPLRYQTVLALRYFEGKSLHDIAEILGKPEGTIKSLLSRGTTRLKLKAKEIPLHEFVQSNG